MVANHQGSQHQERLTCDPFAEVGMIGFLSRFAVSSIALSIDARAPMIPQPVHTMRGPKDGTDT